METVGEFVRKHRGNIQGQPRKWAIQAARTLSPEQQEEAQVIGLSALAATEQISEEADSQS